MWGFKSRSKAILKLRVPGQNQDLNYESIKHMLSSLNGIFSVSINLITNTVRVDFDQKKITIEELRGAVEKACQESVVCHVDTSSPPIPTSRVDQGS